MRVVPLLNPLRRGRDPNGEQPKASVTASSPAFVVVCILLALTLITAAVLKLHGLTAGSDAAASAFGWWAAEACAIVLELALAGWLLSGKRPGAARYAMLAVFAIFAVYTLVRAMRGAESCGCFGRIPVNPWLTLGVDLLAVGALALTAPARRRNQAEPVRSWGGMALACGAVGIAAFAMVRSALTTHSSEGVVQGHSGLIILKPENWLGRPFPLFRELDRRDELSRGDWILMFYHHDCPRCQEALPQLRGLARQSVLGGARVALVEIPPYGPLSDAGENPPPTWTHARLPEAHSWFVPTPTIVLVRAGRPGRAAAGSTRCSRPGRGRPCGLETRVLSGQRSRVR